jgi:hypothetical protein
LSEATLEEFVGMVPEISGTISSGTILLYLADAKSRIDLTIEHPQYSLLQRLMGAHLLHANNLLRGEIINESVADVRMGYMARQNMTDDYADKWEREYYRILANIEGVDGRIY